MLNNNLIDRIRLPFRKEKELYLSLYKILGVVPHNLEYYKQALHHKSMGHKGAKGGTYLNNNERLEYLGDGILDAIVGHICYEHFPKKREGFLTTTRAKVVQRETLNRLAEEMGLCDLILASGTGSQHNSYMGGNAFEALVGALYLDKGYDACMRFMKKKILKELLNLDKVAYKEKNFKSKLLEWGQKNKVKVEFRSMSTKKGEGGSPIFTQLVVIEGVDCCHGTGFTKKESQQEAAKKTLQKLRKQPQLIQAIFAAKTDRTKMEEEPATAVPAIDGSQKKQENPFTEEVFTKQSPAITDECAEKPANERESIIAAAEASAYETDL